MNAELEGLKFNDIGGAFAEYYDDTFDPLRGAEAASRLYQLKMRSDPAAIGTERRIRKSFHDLDLPAMPGDYPQRHMYEWSPVLALDMLYLSQDIEGIHSFVDFMKGRYTDLNAALKRDLPEIIDCIDQRLATFEVAYKGAEKKRRAAAAAYTRIGILALNSFDAGLRNYSGVCYSDDDEALLVQVVNGYKDRVNYVGIGDDFTHLLLHESLHAAHGDLKAGFTRGIDEPVRMSLIEELATETKSRLAMSGVRDLDQVTYANSGSYNGEVELFRALSDYSSADLSLELLFEAQASPRDQLQPSSPRRWLRKQLDVAVAELLPQYAEGGVAELSSAYERVSPQARSSFAGELARLAVADVSEVWFEDIDPGEDTPVISQVSLANPTE